MNPRPTIYVFAGFSGAGKDTAASVLNAKVTKFASPGKKALEFIYSLPAGTMDDRVARQQIAPFSGGLTYLEVLIKLWRNRDLLFGDTLFGEQTKAEILGCLELGKDVAVTDMRNHNELTVMMDIHELGYDVIPVWIDGGTMLESDVHQEEIYRRLCAFTGNAGVNIVNDYPTVETFIASVKLELSVLQCV